MYGRAVMRRRTTDCGLVQPETAVILAIQRQPRRHRHHTLKRIKAMMPGSRHRSPPAVKVNIISDRTETIRLRSATCSSRLMRGRAGGDGDLHIPAQISGPPVIPAVTVRCRWSVLRGAVRARYSLDNLSLMALSIAVGLRGRRRPWS